jgi:hypothetical protein
VAAETERKLAEFRSAFGCLPGQRSKTARSIWRRTQRVTSMNDRNVKISVGYSPGAIGRIMELNAAYCSRHWDFDLYFEAKVARELSD